LAVCEENSFRIIDKPFLGEPQERAVDQDIFLQAFKALQIDTWKPHYAYQDVVISDGTFWKLTIDFTDQTVEIDGHGAKPRNFMALLQLFGLEDAAAKAVMARYFG
jgi:hypothetical protein